MMMNPLHAQRSNPTDQDNPSMNVSEARRTKEPGLKGWIHRHFGAEPPHKHSPNFFISDVTEGGIGSHHHRQVFRSEKRH
jgi:hypothetical protein